MLGESDNTTIYNIDAAPRMKETVMAAPTTASQAHNLHGRSQIQHSNWSVAYQILNKKLWHSAVYNIISEILQSIEAASPQEMANSNDAANGQLQ